MDTPNRGDQRQFSLIACALLYASVIGVMFLIEFGEQPRPAVGSSSVPAAIPAFDELRAAAVSDALTSGDPERVATVVHMPDSVAVPETSITGLAGLGAVRFDVWSTEYRDSSATVHALVGDGTDWTVELVLVNDVWMVSPNTERVW